MNPKLTDRSGEWRHGLNDVSIVAGEVTVGITHRTGREFTRQITLDFYVDLQAIVVFVSLLLVCYWSAGVTITLKESHIEKFLHVAEWGSEGNGKRRRTLVPDFEEE